MIKHDDKEKLPVAETENGAEQLKPHSGKFFRLGVFCLIGLMLLVLLMVGSSFSMIKSEGEITGLPSLTVAGFDVTVTKETSYTAGEPYEGYDDTSNFVVCAFTVTYTGGVVADCEVKFEAEISTDNTATEQGIKFILIDAEGSQTPMGGVDDSNNMITYTYSLTFPIDSDELSKTYVIVADYSAVDEMALKDITLYPSVTVTATQAKEAS